MILDIDSIFDMLSWNQSVQTQARGIEEAKKIRHLSVLIMPIESKLIWENCAKVIASKSDRELQPYFISLLKWFRDMNWPGAYIIYDRLKIIMTSEFEDAYSICLSLANASDDNSWKNALIDFQKQKE